MTYENQEVQEKIAELNAIISKSESKIENAQRDYDSLNEDEKEAAWNRCNSILQVEWERIERTRFLLDGWIKVAL